MSEPASCASAGGRPFHVVVFSFNRGRFLEHCVGSVERHAPGAAITVADDLSDEPETLAALERIERRHAVLRPETTGTDNPKVGGLYANMQLALDALPEDAIFCFLQDDLQLVRDVEPRDLAAIAAHFEASAKAAFLHTTFLRGYRRDTMRLRWDEARGCYFRELAPGQDWGAHFAAVVTGRVDRLRALGWRFANREKLNDARAAELFEPMGYMRDPIAMSLPSVPVYRYRRKSLALRLAERRIDAGFHPYRPLAGEPLRRLRERDVAAPPFAEDFLETESGRPPKPWLWGPFQESRWLRKLDKIERLGAWLGSDRR